jgi:phage terminase large subunit GpA-like protein
MNEDHLALLDELIDATVILKSDEKPSEWYEKNMVMPQGSAFPGPIKYDKTPYWREVVDCVSQSHPARDITIMGPAQNGKSIMVLNPVVGYTIALAPCNILFLTGHSDLTKRAVQKIDFMIYNTGLQPLIKPEIMKARNNRTGDTSFEKQYRGGSMLAGSITNHNLLRQNDICIAIADDLDAGEMAKGKTGSTVDLITGRTKAYDTKAKRFWVSSPQIKGSSLIEQQYNKSDKRQWNVQCPKCHELIVMDFHIQIDDKNTAGLTYKIDTFGRVIPESVGYVCQKCAGFFTDENKYEILNSGLWVPTCEPQEIDHYGYHLHGLYAAPGMTSWFTLAQKYVLCNPPGQPRNESAYQTLVNIDFGCVYEPPGTSIKSSDLQVNNVRGYQIGLVPEKLSIADGNGKVVLLTCAADLGGLVAGINSDHDDVRLDYEVCAWTESGSSYSIVQGSIGTFTPVYMGKRHEARELWSYDISKPNNVWKEFAKIIGASYDVDGTGRKMKVGITGIDTGFAEHHAFNFIDRSNFTIVGLKGDKEHKFIPFGDNTPIWKEAASRSRLYILKVGKLKDQLAQRIALRWDKRSTDPQPPGYLNFPQPGGGMYGYEEYFLHFESEERKLDKNNNFIWQKKSHTVQNHFWDVHNYQMALKDILMENILKELKVKNGTWPEFCEWLLKNRQG